MAVGYNLNHVQVAPVGDTPVYVDVPGVVSWEPSVTSDSEDILADGSNYVSVFSAPTGEGDLTFIDADFAVFATINGGTVSSSGTGETEIERYEQPGQYVAPPFIVADWVPNIDKTHDPSIAGMRTTTPNTTASPVSRSSGQEATQEWTASTNFSADANGVLIIYEKLASEPVFTDGVMPVNVEAPTGV